MQRADGRCDALAIASCRQPARSRAQVAGAGLPEPIKAQILGNLACLSHDAQRLLSETDPARRSSARKALALRFTVLQDHTFWTHVLPPKALAFLQAH